MENSRYGASTCASYGDLMIDTNAYHSLMAQMVNNYPLFNLALTTHKNTRGAPMSFKDKPYLVELYTDLPNLDGADIRKAVQTGLSELFIQLILERAGWAGKICAYVLPTFTIRDRFVQNRIDPLLQTVPPYKMRAGLMGKGSTGNLKLKRFGNGALMFLGSNTVSDFIEFSADVLVIDEFDQCDPTNLAKAKDRLRASTRPQMFRLGNPTLPRVGISRLYEHTDQRSWFTKCDHCNHWQPMDWFANIVERTDKGDWQLRDTDRMFGESYVRPICVKCHQGINREIAKSCWVAKRTEEYWRGYTISRLDVLSENFRALFKEWISAQGHSEMLSTFYTSVLGIPFEFSGSRLTMQMLNEASTGESLDYGGGSEYRNRLVTLGVDVGSVLNFVLSIVDENEQGALIRTAKYVGSVRTFEEVADIIRRYHVDCCVIDAMPETRKAQELRDLFQMEGGCEVWLCRYHPTPRIGQQIYGMKLNYRTRVVTVDRTQVFDATFDEIKDGRRVFPDDTMTVLGWSQQMRAPVRVLNETKSRIIWTEGKSPDHYRHAGIYDRIAYDVSESGGGYFSG